jgi:orotate phosphoribosyltransferase
MRIRDPVQISELLTCAWTNEVASDVYGCIAQTGALLSGHFRLQSGLHSPYFLRFGQIGRDQDQADILSRHLSTVSPAKFFSDATLLCADGPARDLATAIQRNAGDSCRLAVCQLDEARRPVATLRLGHLDPSSKIVIVADVVTTGRSLQPLIEVVRASNARAVGIAAFATLNRLRFDQIASEHGLAGVVLVSATWPLMKPAECELCERLQELFPAYEFN